jgi:hypothetical protein
MTLQFVLPNAEDTPATPSECPIHEPVTRSIAGKFLFPEGAVAGRHLAMFRAAMPEAAVNEDGNSFLAKSKIRLAEQHLIAPPAYDMAAAQKFQQG